MYKAKSWRRDVDRGYLVMDKHKAALLDDVVAIINKKNKSGRSEIILREDRYNSTTSPQKLLERIRAGKAQRKRF